ncbi:hypothetical protein FACS1894199_11070 [Bacteroidia bacterium]|nr:hypothetical protein FACS1894199_11070 [Bacteroidia bacterium]
MWVKELGLGMDLVWTWYSPDSFRTQRYKGIYHYLIFWRRMLFVALTCCFDAQKLLNRQNKKHNYFFPEKEKKKEQKKKKRYAS